MDISLDTVVSALSAAFAGGALIFNGFSTRQKKKQDMVKMIRDYQIEITKLYYSPKRSLENSQDKDKRYEYLLWGYEYLNLHNQLADFALKGYIAQESARHFNETFKKSLDILEKTQFKDQKDKHTKSLEEWCQRESLTADIDI